MRILAFDTSNQPLSVAVVSDDVILAEQLINVKRNHSVQLMPIIDEMLKQAKLSLDEIDRIAVAKGPGFTRGFELRDGCKIFSLDERHRIGRCI